MGGIRFRPPIRPRFQRGRYPVGAPVRRRPFGLNQNVSMRVPITNDIAKLKKEMNKLKSDTQQLQNTLSYVLNVLESAGLVIENF